MGLTTRLSSAFGDDFQPLSETYAKLAFSADDLRNDATGWERSENTFIGLTAAERL
jgi:hypothetical protein